MAYAARKLCQLPLLNQNGRWLMRFRGKRVEFVFERVEERRPGTRPCATPTGTSSGT